jgi:hypothetical protein
MTASFYFRVVSHMIRRERQEKLFPSLSIPRRQKLHAMCIEQNLVMERIKKYAYICVYFYCTRKGQAYRIL